MNANFEKLASDLQIQIDEQRQRAEQAEAELAVYAEQYEAIMALKDSIIDGFKAKLAEAKAQVKTQMVAKHRMTKLMCWVVTEMDKKPDDSRLDIINEALEMNGISGFDSHESIDYLWEEVENEKAKEDENEHL